MGIHIDGGYLTEYSTSESYERDQASQLARWHAVVRTNLCLHKATDQPRIHLFPLVSAKQG